MTPVERVDLEIEMQVLRDRIREMETHQWWANGRIRQDVNSVALAAYAAVLVGLCIWANVEFRWWYVVGYALLASWFGGSISSHVMDQEQRRSV